MKHTAQCTACRYTRHYENGLAAEVYAIKHSIYRQHPVKILADGELVRWAGENRTEPIEFDDPPF